LVQIEVVLNSITEACHPLIHDGANADYIRPLAQVQRDFGIALCQAQGVSESGATTRFSVQSITKVMALVYALHKFGARVWDVVGVNASGKAFNDLSLLQTERLPRNPCINAGALAVTAFLQQRGELESFTEFLAELSGEVVNIDEEVAVGEMRDCQNNRRICELLKSNGVIEGGADVEEVLWFYCQQCAISMNCAQLAKTLMLLANGGRSLNAETSVISRADTAKVNAVMMTAGTYDNAGRVLADIQAPAKSGVGGGIVAIYPRRGVACAWSPGLDVYGNSIAAQRALSMLTEEMNWSLLS
jgi:glutaminase